MLPSRISYKLDKQEIELREDLIPEYDSLASYLLYTHELLRVFCLQGQILVTMSTSSVMPRSLVLLWLITCTKVR